MSIERHLRLRGPRLLASSLAVLAFAAATVPAHADHDPAHTATIYVHGFDPAGMTRVGTYGEIFHEDVADSVARLVDLPTANAGDGPLPPNVVIGVDYYGDSPPAWYSAADRAAVDSVTAAWGGGVPRYATIVAKFARHVLARSGAQQVNFVSASYGSLIVRWLIEKNVEQLAGDGRIARWLSVEGLLGGNWAASHATEILDFLALDPVDVGHMSYDWIDAHLHLPHSEADSPLYAGIAIGEVASTDDSYNHGALSIGMAADRGWAPNDGLQALPDAVFQSITPRSRYVGLTPTLALFHATHFGLRDARGAWAEAATFLTQSKRVTVTMTSATVANLHEPELPFLDLRPGEIVFESRVTSPAVAARWGIRDPICAILEAGGAAPLRYFARDGETQTLDHVVFDDFVLDEETALDLDLRAYDVDNDPHYDVYETVSPALDDLGEGRISVSTLAPGTYTFAARDWSCELTVKITSYPFDARTAVPEPLNRTSPSPWIAPNPSRGPQRIGLRDLGADKASGASLEILDLSGRVVRRVDQLPPGGYAWDGRDADGRIVPSGIYRVRIVTAKGTRGAWSVVLH